MSIDTIDTRLGDFTVLGPFNWDHSGVAGDFGDGLNTGNWNNLKDVPGSDATSAQYTGGGKNGGVSTHDGSYTGPVNNVDLDGTIVAAKWGWRVRKVLFNPAFKGKFGRTVEAAPSTDNTTTTAQRSLTTSLQNFWEVKDADDASAPDTDDWLQIGVEKVGSGTMRVTEMWTFILHQEPVEAVTEQPAIAFGANF